MALKPTIYKFSIALSDMDRDHYDSFSLTVAQHPSETLVRMSARVLAYCINAAPGLAFTKGVSAVDEPDLWLREMDDQISLWIDIGEPSIERIKKGSNRAQESKLYAFNSKTDVWWTQVGNEVKSLGVKAYRFDIAHLEDMVALLNRTNQLSITISEQTAGIATDEGYCDVSWQTLE
jgi:uncharacterized protein YaeQ